MQLWLSHGTLINPPQSSLYFWKIRHTSLSRLKHSLTVTSTSWFGRSSSTFRLLSYWNKTWIKWKMRTGQLTWTFDLLNTNRISMRNRSVRCRCHAYINKCIHANNGKQITWFRLNINCIGWWSESKICVDQTTLTFGSSIWKTGTQFLSWPWPRVGMEPKV